MLTVKRVKYGRSPFLAIAVAFAISKNAPLETLEWESSELSEVNRDPIRELGDETAQFRSRSEILPSRAGSPGLRTL